MATFDPTDTGAPQVTTPFNLGLGSPLINQPPALGLGGPQITLPSPLNLGSPLVTTQPNLGLGNPNVNTGAPDGGLGDLIAKAITKLKVPNIESRALGKHVLGKEGSYIDWQREKNANLDVYTGKDLEEFLHKKLSAFPGLADALYGTGAVHAAVITDPKVEFDTISENVDEVAGRRGNWERSPGEIMQGAYDQTYYTRDPSTNAVQPMSHMAFERGIQGSPTVLHEALHAAAGAANRAAGLPFKSNVQWRPRYSYGSPQELIEAVRQMNGYDLTRPQDAHEVPTTFGEASYVAQNPNFDLMASNPYYAWARFFKAQRKGKDPIVVNRVPIMGGTTSPLSPIPQNQIDYAAQYRDNLINKLIEYYVKGYQEPAPEGLRP